MTDNAPTTQVRVALDAEPDGSSSATCPLCHTTHPSLTNDVLAAGASWRCATCGQKWHAGRLLAVSRYAAWVARRG